MRDRESRIAALVSSDHFTADVVPALSTFGCGGGSDAALRYIDYGALALCRKVIAACPADTSFGLEQVQQDLARDGTLRAFVACERFYEIGSELGIADLEARLSGR